MKLLQKRKEKELELEDDQSSVKDDETKGELVCGTCYLSGQPCITQYLYTQAAQFVFICIPLNLGGLILEPHQHKINSKGLCLLNYLIICGLHTSIEWCVCVLLSIVSVVGFQH